MAAVSDVIAPPAPTVPTRAPESAAKGATTEARVVAASIVGVGIALSGFPPLNNLTALFHVGALPGFALLTLPVLVTGLAVWMSRGTSRARGLPLVAAAPLALITLGACLSLTASPHPAYSSAILILGVLAPLCLFLSARRGNLPPAILAGSFLAALSLVLLRADLVFLQQNGFPTLTKIYDAKFANRPYDFHYYTLGNPDHTATFLLLPFAVCLAWSLAPSCSRRTVWLLRACAAVIFLTLILTFGRFPLFIATVLVLLAVIRSGLPRPLRIGIVVVAIAGAVAAAIGSPGHYLTHIFSTTTAASGTVRVNSISRGLDALKHAPLTGVGLGQFGLGPSAPAHSSLVQTGAETGIAGLAGMALLTLVLVLAVGHRAYRRTGFSLRNAALGASALYACVAAVAVAGGLFVGLVSIYGLTLALFAGIGCTPAETLPSVPLSEAWGKVAGRVRRRSRARANRTQLRWLAYGLAWIPIGVVVTASRLPESARFSGSRLQALNQVLLAHRLGFGPLVEMLGPHSFFPAGPTDDQGGYLVTPWLSDLLHTTSINTITRTLFIVGVCAVVASYPLAIHRLTGSRVAALASPVLALLFLNFLTDDGFYWIPAITLALCLPWLLIFARERVAPPGALIGIAAIAGLTGLFRSETGLGLLIAAVAICLLALAPRTRKILTIAGILLAYAALGSGVLDLALQSRASRMHAQALTTGGEAGITSWADSGNHPFWHTVYIGLGVVPNKYGITYDDSVAAAYVRSIDAAAPYAGPEYEAILRSRVLHLVASDPRFVARAETRKIGLLLADGLGRFWPLLLIVPVAFALGMGRLARRRYAAVVLPVAAIAILPALVAVPVSEYELPWLGLLATTGVICCCWLLARAGAWATAPDGVLRRHPLAETMAQAWARWRRRWARATLAIGHACQGVVRPLASAGRRLKRGLGAAVAPFRSQMSVAGSRRWLLARARSRTTYVVVAVVIAGFIGRAYLDSWQLGITKSRVVPLIGATALPFDAQLNAPITAWQLGAFPTGWTIQRGTRIARGPRLGVLTTPQRNGYQLLSPALRLPSGKYQAAVRGQIGSGGLAVGVLDVAANKWLSITVYTALPGHQATTMISDFRLRAPRRVMIILSNASATERRSTWVLTQASIAPRTAPVVANPLPVDTSLAQPVRHWRLAPLPPGWTVVAGARALSGRALALSTISKTGAYQLLSPRLTLPSGRYVAAIRGKLQAGGMELGVLDVRTDRWLAVTSYSAMLYSKPGTFTDDFTIATHRTVRIILSDLATSGAPSEWRLTQAVIAPHTATASVQKPSDLALPPLAGHAGTPGSG